MTSMERSDGLVPMVVRVIVLPMMITLASVVPSILSPTLGVRRVAFAAIVLGLLWLAGAGVFLIYRWVTGVRVELEDLRVDLFRQKALQELGARPDELILGQLMVQLRSDLGRQHHPGQRRA